MQWRWAAVVLSFTLAGSLGPQARAAPAGFGVPVAIHADPAVQDVYWVWRGGVRVWVGGPYRGPYYAPPRYYGPPHYRRPPYWYGGRGYWHRRWHGGRWRYW